MRLIRVEDCSVCPFYERLVGRTVLYHYCRDSNMVIKGDFMGLFKYCELEEMED